jgi:hypothetical protein
MRGADTSGSLRAPNIRRGFVYGLLTMRSDAPPQWQEGFQTLVPEYG